ncbi:MacS family sensor histidine kinase [Millisia brevis]|uniref:MacS family sensor histidine kinase n=1 Tax=Millisia brevis TaxID=264148 RepID=UPI000830B2B2|nr:DUF5931 domain-containing protein [Millisia brevis]
MSRSTATSHVTEAEAPLWRAAAAFRLLTIIYAVSYHSTVAGNQASPRLSWVVFGLIIAWTGLSAIALATGWGRPRMWAAFDQVVVIGAVMATVLVATTEWRGNNQVLPTTLWVTNAVVSGAIAWGPWFGALIGGALAVLVSMVRGDVAIEFWSNATVPVLVSVGLAVGVAARSSRHAAEQLRAATELEAATRERDRLARQVHDGVLQVLAMVHRRGREIGGEAAELARIAGEQEAALRRLISGLDRVPTPAEKADLAARLRAIAAPDVTVSAPAQAVLVDAATAGEVLAAVEAAVTNTRLHAGRDARSFILVEDLDGEIVISVRDDGVGMPDDRPADAQREGRMGIAKSIVGRIHQLGGTAQLRSAPDDGTEWELRVPLRER